MDGQEFADKFFNNPVNAVRNVLSTIGNGFSTFFNDPIGSVNNSMTYITGANDYGDLLGQISGNSERVAPFSEGAANLVRNNLNLTKAHDLYVRGSSNDPNVVRDDSNDIESILDSWYSNIKSADEAANLIAQQNAQAAMDFNRSEREAAEAYNENAYRHRYQWTYDDMKAAGINPIIGLASMGVGASPSSSPTSTSAAQTFMRDQTLVDQILPIIRIVSALISGLTSAKSK